MLRTIGLIKTTILLLAGFGLVSAGAHELANSHNSDDQRYEADHAPEYGTDGMPIGHQHGRPDTPKVPANITASPVKWQCTPYNVRVGDSGKATRNTVKAMLKKEYIPFDHKCAEFDDKGKIHKKVNLKKGWWIFKDKYGELHVDITGIDGQPKKLQVYLADANGNRDMRNSVVTQTNSNGKLEAVLRIEKTVTAKGKPKKELDFILHMKCRAYFTNHCE